LRNFVYRCPATGLNVQGSVADEEHRGRRYVAQSCLACNGVHVVDPMTGSLPPERSPTAPPKRTAERRDGIHSLRKTP
jgi:hypothetical protein